MVLTLANEVSTGRGPGSPRGQPAWGGGCDRVTIPAISILAIAATRSLPLPVLTPFPTEVGTLTLAKYRMPQSFTTLYSEKASPHSGDDALRARVCPVIKT